MARRARMPALRVLAGVESAARRRIALVEPTGDCEQLDVPISEEGTPRLVVAIRDELDRWSEAGGVLHRRTRRAGATAGWRRWPRKRGGHSQPNRSDPCGRRLSLAKTRLGRCCPEGLSRRAGPCKSHLRVRRNHAAPRVPLDRERAPLRGPAGACQPRRPPRAPLGPFQTVPGGVFFRSDSGRRGAFG